jgi:hypothetical protein
MSKEVLELRAATAKEGELQARKLERRTERIKALGRAKVLHISVDKTDRAVVNQLLLEMTKNQITESAYLHATPLADPEIFEVFVNMLQQTNGRLSFLNIGEIRFKRKQLKRLKAALRNSTVTHMFYECAYCGPEDKVELRSIVNANRQKHKRWIYTKAGGEGDDAVIKEMEKCWFNPSNHSINKLAVVLEQAERRCMELSPHGRAEEVEEAAKQLRIAKDKLSEHPETQVRQVKRLLRKMRTVEAEELQGLLLKTKKLMGGVLDKNLKQVLTETKAGNRMHALRKHECADVAELAASAKTEWMQRWGRVQEQARQLEQQQTQQREQREQQQRWERRRRQQSEELQERGGSGSESEEKENQGQAVVVFANSSPRAKRVFAASPVADAEMQQLKLKRQRKEIDSCSPPGEPAEKAPPATSTQALAARCS